MRPFPLTFLALSITLTAGCFDDKDDTSSGTDTTSGYDADADADADGYDATDDCDDADATVNPGADEIPYDGVDNDCDSTTPDDDLDGDGVLSAADCDDDDPDVHPGADEACNGTDDDCDGTIDEGASDAQTFWADADGDGWGDSSDRVEACELPSGYAAQEGDCDDDDAAVFPGAIESCNSVDDDCDGVVDNNSGLDWYTDADGDGFGDASDGTQSCDGSSGTVADSTDCDDGDATVHPGADEICDDADQDCDGTVDEGAVDAPSWYGDADGDGYGDPATVTRDCDQPSNTVDDGTDCDDSSADAHPGGIEACDGLDNDCDGFVDEDEARGASTWYLDVDGDGYGGDTATVTACDQPSNAVDVSLATDCDDGDASVNPGASETYYDGIDSDCAGDDDFDQDADGYQHDGYGGTDCNDTDPSINPAATETFYNGVDEDCDGASDYDADSDGYDSDLAGGSDCDDTDAGVYPGADEVDIGVDNDCDGEVELAPVAVASHDPTDLLAHCAALNLDGTGSYDPDGTALTYDWDVTSVPSGSTIGTSDLDDSTSATPVVNPDLAGDYDFTLTVTDEGDASDSDTLSVTIATRTINTTPIADAGSDQTVSATASCIPIAYGEGGYECDACADERVALDASASTDAEGEELSYSWSVISGSASLTASTSAAAYATMTGFDTEFETTYSEDFVFEVAVTDCFGDTDTAQVTVTFECTGE